MLVLLGEQLAEEEEEDFVGGFFFCGWLSIAIAAVTEAAGLSLALGAFLGGMLLGSSDFVKRLEHQTMPLRDAFVALFFVTIGMLIDPRTWVASWQIILVIIGLVIAGKFVVWFCVVRLFGYSNDTAVRVGIGLTQIGEFSFILAQVSQRAGLITTEIYHATLAASLVTILANATLFKLLLARAPTRRTADESADVAAVG